MKTRTFRLRHPDTGVELMPVEVRVYSSFESMRHANYQYDKRHPDGLIAHAFSHCRRDYGGVVLLFCEQDLSMRVIAHECAHAAVYLRYSISDSSDGIGLWEELFPHLYDDVFCAVLDWIIRNIQPFLSIEVSDD